MAIFAGLPSNLFPSTPPNPRINDPTTSKPISLPIPIPKYPKQVKNRTPKPNSSDAKPNPAFKTIHRRTKYYKPISDGVIAEEDDRSVILGESGVSYLLPGAPFEFQFSYSETPKVKPLAIREPAFLPFAPPTMPRPWTGKAPLKKSKKKIPLFDSFNPPPFGSNGVKQLEMPDPLKLGKYSKEDKSREEVLGRPLSRDEIRKMVKPLLSSNRQLNLGRDGLTHNMLEMVHTHWKRQEVCKVRCRGVPTVDMDNVCYHLEEKTGGRIIHRAGGVLYLFRGRNYNYRTRPQYPIMLWKPAAPVYPKLIQEAPEGLTKKEADDLRKKGEKLLPICKLAKNGIYINLVKEVRNAFESSALVKINCQGLHASDYKKIGAKLKVLVPCVLLSFDQEQILIWRGKEWKSRYPRPLSIDSITNSVDGVVPVTRDDSDGLIDTDGKLHGVRSSRMMSLWRHAVESSKALVLDDLNLSPDALLEKVEMFVGMSQAMEHSYPALILPNTEPNQLNDRDSYESDLELEDDDEESASFEDVEESIPRGSLPVDSIVKRFDLE